MKPEPRSSLLHPIPDATAAVRVRLIDPDDPWVRAVEPALYRKWTDELGTNPAKLLILTTERFSHLSEPLLMWVAWEMEQRHRDVPVVAWDFQVSVFAPVTFIDWQHVVNVAYGREERYGPDNPAPEDMTEEQFEERWKHLDEPKKKRFWRRLSVKQTGYTGLER